MSVRAKFYVSSKTEVAPGGKYQVAMNPVMSGSPENKEFYYYSPGGKLELTTINGEAAAQLQVGKEYYLDITEAPTPAPAEPSAT